MRFIYNTTYHVENKIEKDWIIYMRETIIPYVESHILSSDILFTRFNGENEEIKSFSLQIVFDGIEQLDEFINRHKDHINNLLSSKFGQQFLYFCTSLEEI